MNDAIKNGFFRVVRVRNGWALTPDWSSNSGQYFDLGDMYVFGNIQEMTKWMNENLNEPTCGNKE
jgi:hypothetical protein